MFPQPLLEPDQRDHASEARAEILKAAGEETWRMMRLLMAGTAHVMSERSTGSRHGRT